MTPEILSQALALPPIAQAAMAGAEDPRYERRPSGRADWSKRARMILEQSSRDWLGQIASAFDASGEAAKRLARSASGNGLVVTTGQQPGLFGGPVYTLSKAVTALALANALEELTGVPVAPVFWAATDDSDFREASRIAIQARDGVHDLVLDRAAPLGPAMSKMPLGDVSELLAALAGAAGSAAYPEPLALVQRSYTPEHTIGGAYVALLRSLLAPLGVAVLDASHDAVRKASLPVIKLALERGENIARLLAESNAAIQSAGYTPQVHDVPGLSLVFESTADGRKRIPLKRAGRAVPENAELGPNVLLRPIVERQILPTLTYVGGPSEIAYFAQLGPIADALDLPRPLIVPRWSGSIVEPHIRKILDALGLDIPELRDPHAAETRIARDRIPDELLREVERLRDSIEIGTAALGSALQSQPFTLGQSIHEGLRRNLLHRVDRMERRLIAASKRQHAALMRDVATARGSLYPAGQPQERALSYIPFLARYGGELVDGMLRAAGEHARSLI
jgi:bacillithiol synthase